MEDISDDCIIKFIHKHGFESFEDLCLEVENTQVKNARWEDRKDFKLNKIINSVYSTIIEFPPKKFEIKTVVTKEFLTMLEILFMDDT